MKLPKKRDDMTEVKRFSLVKPTTETPFHIDFDWWKQQDKDWRIFLNGYLCNEHQTAFSSHSENAWIDWVDPETAEVTRVDGLLHTLITHCARQPSFVTGNTSLVDSVFRVLLANSNLPMTPQQLGDMTARSPETILRTLSSGVIYKGMRPLQS
jgi:hypothetical protein